MFILFFFTERFYLFKENPPKVRVILVFLFCKRFTWHFTTKIFVSCKIRNHPQINQTTHKPVKYQTNHPLITQKLPRFFLKIFFMNRNIFLTHPAREEKWVHF